MVRESQAQDVAQGATPGGRQMLLVLALMMAVSLAALEVSVIATAMPTIAGSLGGLRLFSWVFSIYLLTSTVGVPIFGKLADLYGRKPVILFGVVLFLIGSVLCGASQSMEMLIVSRAVQGLGAGSVLPITITIIGDTFSIEQRARIQGFFSGVWGVTGVAGPAIGGLITDHVSWRWVFYLNVPFCLASIALIGLFYIERAARRQHALDYRGAALLSGSVVCLLLAFLHAGEAYGWLAVETLALFGASAALLALFVWQETKAAEPVVPLSLFRSRVILVSSLAVFLAGVLMFGVTSYIPLFEQGVFGGSATEAGLVLAPMSVAWVVGAIVCGRLLLRTGFFPPAVAGGTMLAIGGAGLLLLTKDSTILVAIVASSVMGIGMGFTTNTTIIAVQNAVDWGQRGVATASTQFFRTIGGSIGVAIMGALLNSRIDARLEGTPGEGQRTEAILDAADRAALPEPVLQAMQSALASSLQEVFLIVFAAGCLCFAALLFFPRRAGRELAAAPDPRQAVAEPADPGSASGG